MEVKLKNLLEGALVVPYDEGTITRLETVCDSFIEDEDFNDDIITDLAVIVLTHTQNAVIKGRFEKSYQSQNEGFISLPRSVIEALSAFTINKALEKDEVSYYLALLNCIVLVNGRLEHVSFPELFADCVEKSIQGVDSLATLENVEDETFINDLFKENSSLIGSTMDAPKLLVIKKLVREAWYHRMKEYIDSEELQEYSAYEKVFVAIRHIVNNMPWTFLNQQAMQQIRDLTPLSNEPPLSIKEIIDKVRPLYANEDSLSCSSSILLQVIADKDAKAATWPFMNSTLTVREFAVYLYYELLLEKNFE